MRTDMEHGSRQFNVAKVTGAVVHVLIASQAPLIPVDRAQTRIQ